VTVNNEIDRDRHAKTERSVKHALYTVVAFAVALLLGVASVTIIDLSTITNRQLQDRRSNTATLNSIQKQLTDAEAKLAAAEKINGCQNAAFDLILLELKEAAAGHKLTKTSLGPKC
jgi:hypothetical protein